VFERTGGEDEANDEGKAGSYRSDLRGNIVARAKKRKAGFWTSLSPPLVIVAGMRGWCCGTKDVAYKPTNKRSSSWSASRALKESVRCYDEKVQTALVKLWRVIDYICGKPNRKNDNCFVEQKNYSIVRRAVGYQRYDTELQLRLLNELYATLRLYSNFFQPTMKLTSKERVGSKVTKRYDRAQTPYQRVLVTPRVSKAAKERCVLNTKP
jgi:hypothetical protein